MNTFWHTCLVSGGHGVSHTGGGNRGGSRAGAVRTDIRQASVSRPGCLRVGSRLAHTAWVRAPCRVLLQPPVLRTRTAGRRARSARLLVASTPSTRKNRRRCCRCLRSRRAKRALSRSVNRRFSAIRASSHCARSRSHSAKSCWQFRTGGLGGCIFVFVRLARKW
jgi:hypothetical protein